MSYETKTLPSGIVIENRPGKYEKHYWFIKDTDINHNEGEPAVEYNNGTKLWQQYNKYHRLDGPTLEYSYKYYYINDVYYKEEEYWKHPNVIAYMYLKGHPELEGFV